MKVHGAFQIASALTAMVFGGIFLWTSHVSKQAIHTSLISSQQYGMSYDIKKNEKNEWALEVNGKPVATMKETNNAPLKYSFSVTSSSVNAPAVGARFEILSAESGQTLICSDCVQQYIKLPLLWSRME